ncbi:hypothetical protein ACE6H2_019979 [Prunus campanulata]
MDIAHQGNQVVHGFVGLKEGRYIIPQLVVSFNGLGLGRKGDIWMGRGQLQRWGSGWGLSALGIAHLPKE